MNRLLVFADDASRGADEAWDWVCAQTWPGWRVDVLTVTDQEPGTEMHARSPEQPRQAPASSGISSVRHLSMPGDPRRVLAEVDADLLVLGPRGSGLLKKLHLGSVAESLLDCPGAPTVIAKGSSAVRRVTLAVDGSSHARAATRLLLEMPWIKQAHVEVVAVETGDGLADQAARAAASELSAVGIEVVSNVMKPSELSLTVNIRHDLNEFVSGHPCDLVVMGTRGMTGLKRLRLGSTADYMAHHVECPILLVRADEGA